MSDKPKLHMITGEFAAVHSPFARKNDMANTPYYVLALNLMDILKLTKSIQQAGVDIRMGTVEDRDSKVAYLKVNAEQFEAIKLHFDPVLHESIQDYKDTLENNNP